MTISIRQLLEQFPREWTVGQILDRLEVEETGLRSEDVRCARPFCGRLIIPTAYEGRWTHLAPDGSLSRGCKSAAYDDPRPGDDDHREWLDWPRSLERKQALPPRRY